MTIRTTDLVCDACAVGRNVIGKVVEARTAEMAPEPCSACGKSAATKAATVQRDAMGATMKLVIVESPLRGPARRNRAYLLAALKDSLGRGEAPFASHALYPQVLDDDVPAERTQGIEAGLAWGAKAELTAVYADLGVSPGMQQGIERAKAEGRAVELRTVPGWRWAK